MKNPILLKANVGREEAIELIDYLYCDRITETETKTEIAPLHDRIVIIWFCNGEKVAKWTSDYKNIMISKDFLENR